MGGSERLLGMRPGGPLVGAPVRPRDLPVLALAPLLVLAVDPRGWSPYGPVKWLVASVVALAAMAALAGWGRPRVAVRPTTIGAALVLWLALAAAVGEDRRYAWVGTPERHLGVLTWAGLLGLFVIGQSTAALGPRAARRVVASAIVALVGLALWAAAELAGWEAVALDVDTTRLTGPFGSGAFSGAAAALLVPVGCGVALDATWSRRWRSAAAAGAVGGLVALLGSGARAAWLGSAVAALVVVVAAVRRSRGGGARLVHRVPGGLAGVVVAAALVLGAGAAVVGSTAGWARVGGTFTADQGGLRGRLDEWRVAARVVRAHPLVGVGPEGYRVAFPGAVDAAYERAHGRAVLPDRAHSAVLDVAAAGGLPALVLFAGWWACACGAAWRAARHGPVWACGLGAGVLAYGAGQLLLFPLAEVDPIAWLLAGVLVGVSLPTTDVAPRPAWALRPVGLALGVLAVGAGVWGVADVRADRAAHEALELLDAGRTEAAAGATRRAVAARPDALRYRLVAAQALAARGSVAGVHDALEEVAAAHRTSPGDPVVRARAAELRSRLADLSGAADDARAAEQAWAAVVAADPVNARDRLAWGLALARAGEPAAAAVQWRRAEDLAPHDPEPTLALGQLALDEGRLDDAAAAADRAAARAPGDARVADLRAALAAARAGAPTTTGAR